jgi:predicted nuclease with TOPRIM domain
MASDDDELKQRLAQLRHETAIEWERLSARPDDEMGLRERYYEQLDGLGLTEAEMSDEYVRMVRQATPAADRVRYERRELLRRHLAGEQLSPEELKTVEVILENGSEDSYLSWRSDAEKEAGDDG